MRAHFARPLGIRRQSWAVFFGRARAKSKLKCQVVVCSLSLSLSPATANTTANTNTNSPERCNEVEPQIRCRMSGAAERAGRSHARLGFGLARALAADRNLSAAATHSAKLAAAMETV